MSGRGLPANLGESPIMGSDRKAGWAAGTYVVAGLLAVLISGALAFLGVCVVAYVPNDLYLAEAVLILSGLAFVLGFALFLQTPGQR